MTHYKAPVQGKVGQVVDVIVLLILAIGALYVPLLLGLAVIEGRLTADQVHELARIDEEFQAERWGRDEEADEAAANRLAALRDAERFWTLSRSR